MAIVVILYCLGNNDKKRECVYAQYKYHNHRPNYIVHISNIAFFFKYFSCMVN